MKKTGYCLLIIVLTVLTSCSISEKEVSIESLLNEMIDRDVLATYPEVDFRLKQESSYNRASVSPEDTVGWFTNHDLNNNDKDQNFLRIEEHSGQKEWVLMDHQGAGAIVRTWMPFRSTKKPETNSIIKIYLDGANDPVLEGNMLGLLNGTGLIPFPLAHKSLRSAVSFFPIPYAQSCKVTVTERPFFYQFTYREYPEGTDIKTFTKDDFQNAEGLINEVCKSLLDPQNYNEGELLELQESLGANKEISIELPEGTSALRNLSLKLGDYTDSMVMRSVILKIEFDGQETVWCPVGDFFGSGIGLNPFQGWYRTVGEDGSMSCRWVMPYKESAKVSILNLGEEAVDVKLEAVVGDWKWDENSMYFNAAWRGEYPVSTRPFSDWNYVTLKGRGVYVGDALTVLNPLESWWGEGDEKIWVDGEDFPSIFGTGTEDYYGYSWGGMSSDFYEHPFHAQTRCYVYNKLNRKTKTGERNTKGYSTETRTRSLDVMPFGSSLQLDMEVWNKEVCEMAYGVGVYWYGDASTTSNRLPDPEGVVNHGIKLPVSSGLALDLNADVGVTIEDDNMVVSWTNQAPTPKAVDFKITEEGRTKTIITQEELGTGRPTLSKRNSDINGHNSLIFREDELINENDEAFHGMMTGSGYTWFAVIKPFEQGGPGKINSNYPNAFFGCLRNSGPPQKETGQYAGFWGSFYPDGRVYMGSRNGLNVKVRDGVNTPEVEGPPPAVNEWHIIMGRQGSGQGTVKLELFVDNPSEAINSSDYPVGNVEPSRMAIGTERNAINHQGKESFDGELARLLMFETALDQKEMKKVYDYLRKVYF